MNESFRDLPCLGEPLLPPNAWDYASGGGNDHASSRHTGQSATDRIGITEAGAR
jgi:hypothetical protein